VLRDGVSGTPVPVLRVALGSERADSVYGPLARRWSKIMLALFAVGFVTGTILRFEFGLLWPGFMASLRVTVFGDRLHRSRVRLLRRRRFLIADLLSMSWDRLPSWLAIALRCIPVAIAAGREVLLALSVKPGS